MTRRVIPLCVCLIVLFSVSFQARQSSSGMTLVLSERTDASRINAIARAADGSVWIVGPADPGMPTTPDALQPAQAGGGDAFVERIAPDGSLVYLTYLGGSAWDQATAVTLDESGNVYVAGNTQSTNFPTTDGALDRHSRAAFITKLAPDGRSILYSTYFGGSAEASPRALAVDGHGSLHVVGQVWGTGFPVTPDAAQATTNNADPSYYDGFYARVGAGGSTLAYATYLGGTQRDIALGLVLDAAGTAYVTGWTHSSNFPLKNAFKTTFGGQSQGFLARFTSAGLDSSTFIGGSGSDDAVSVALSPTAVYVVGSAESPDFPGSPRVCPAGWCYSGTYIARIRLDGGALLSSAFLNASGSTYPASVAVDASDVVSVTGTTYASDFPATPDAFQRANASAPFNDGSPNAPGDAFFATVPMTGGSAGHPSYATYLGGNGNDASFVMAPDGHGGAWLSGDAPTPDFPIVNPKQSAAGQAFLAHFAVPEVTPPPADAPDVVLYARDASATGNWQLVADSTAAGGTRIWNPDAGVAKIATASAAPASFFDLTFEAQAGVPYHLWLRMKADNDSYANDSVFVQFSDSVDGGGSPIWRTATTGATVVSLEDCSGCGEHGWGWNDNGYATAGQAVTFATSGQHTVRVQQREDGISIDQIVLSTRASAPGDGRDDTHIVPQPSDPPPADPREIVLYVAGGRLAGGQNWLAVNDATAAGGARLFNPDQGAVKSSSPAASGQDYFDVQFTAEAGVPYHLWVRSQALNDYYGNDSVMVQFSDSVDANGAAIYRVGSNSSTNVILEDCSGCPEQGWGWTDNSYGAWAAPIYFSKSGPQTVRVLRREDGISIDQIVLSAGRFVNAAPGRATNDNTIVPR